MCCFHVQVVLPAPFCNVHTVKKIVGLIALLGAFPPLSTDMYLAAIPLLREEWGEPLTVINLTLICFFCTYCCFLLVYGPLSDRYGRRPPLLAGLLLYVAASVLCATAADVVTMIIARALQGAGAAAASSIAFAICKDLFTGRVRQRIFLQLGVIIAAAPMIAPVIGGWIIESFSWRYVFILQAVMGLTAMAGVYRVAESLVEPDQGKLRKVFSSYLRLMGNPPFFLLVLALACLGLPFFAFIASSSEIYISDLGYSEKVYGYFFAVNSSAFMLAPFVFIRMEKYFSLRRLLPLSYIGVLLASLVMSLFPLPLPYRLTGPMWFLTFFFAFGRPPGNNLILEQVDQDVGAASSLMIFFFFIIGAGSMWLISCDWQDKIAVLGWLGTGSAAGTLLAWLAINRVFKLKFP